MPPESVEIPVSTADNTTGACLRTFPHTSLPAQVLCKPLCGRGTTPPVWVIIADQSVDTDISSVQRLSQNVIIDIMALVVLPVFSFEPWNELKIKVRPPFKLIATIVTLYITFDHSLFAPLFF